MRRVGSEAPVEAGFLSVPKLQQRDMGSTKRLNLPEFIVSSGSIQGSRHELWLHPHSQQQLGGDSCLGSPSSAAPSEDVSPECVAPAVMLVPPPYGAAAWTSIPQSPASPRPANITPDEESQTDIHIQTSVDKVSGDIIHRRRDSTVNLSVDSETVQEPTPRNFFNLRSISGSSSDVPPDTDATSGDTNLRQTSLDTTQPCTSETDTFPSSSQQSVEDEPDDAWTQQSPLEASAETIAVPVTAKLQVTEIDTNDGEGQEVGRVTDRRFGCEQHSVQGGNTEEHDESESVAEAFGDNCDGSNERLVVSASSGEETYPEQSQT